MAQPGFKSSGGLHLEGRLQPSIQDEASIDQVASDNQWIRQSSQEQLLEGGIAVLDHQPGGRESSEFIVPKLNNKRRKKRHLRPEQTQSFPRIGNFQNENSRDNQTLPSTVRLSLKRCLFPHSHQSKVEKISQVSSKQSNLPVHGFAVGLVTAPLEFTKAVKEVKLMAQTRGIRIHQYLDDWLFRAPCWETCLDQTQTLLDLCQKLGWMVNLKKLELVLQQEFNYHFNLSGSSQAHSRNPDPENKDAYEQRQLFCPSVHVS